MTLHKKQCLPGLPKAQAQEAPLHKERPLRGPTRESALRSEFVTPNGQQLFPQGKRTPRTNQLSCFWSRSCLSLSDHGRVALWGPESPGP